MTEALPDCMMPDGAEPCAAHQKLRVEIESLLHDNDRLLDSLNKCESAIALAAKRERELAKALSRLLWLHEDDQTGVGPVASEYEWDEAWECASEALAKIGKEK